MADKDAPGSAEENQPAAGPPSDPGVSAPVKIGRLRGWIWPLVCLFQLGLILGGMRYVLRPPPPESQEERNPNEPAAFGVPLKGPAEPPPLPAPPVGEMGRADDMLREGRYETALAIYEPLVANAAASMRDTLLYRIGLCQEGLGRWDQAIDTYRTLASRTGQASLSAAAQLGQARTWVRMKRPSEAKTLLYDLMLRSAQPGIRDQTIGDAARTGQPAQPFLADVGYLLALALTLEALHPVKPGPLNDSLASHTSTDWAVERLMDSVAPPQEREPVSLQPTEDVIVVQRLRPGAEDLMVRATVRQAPLVSLINQLAEKSGLRTEWSAAAEQLAAGRSSKVQIDGLPLPDVLRALTDPQGLVWRIEGDTIRLTAEHESERQALSEYRLTIARRALRDAILAHPGHPITPSAWLELGNLEIQAGRIPDGIGWYERLIRELPRSSVVIEASYNLGMTHHRQAEFQAARVAFYNVVDRAPGHELAPLAYLRVGQTCLEEMNLKDAPRPLHRAVASGTGSSALPAAVVHLSAAYLLAGNPRAASAILLEQRSAVLREPYRSTAAFLDSFARFRATTDKKELQREASVLLGAVLGMEQNRVLRPVGRLLLGQAYHELGLDDQMARVFERALPESRGRIAAEMSFALANAWYAERHEDALRLLQGLAKGGEPDWSGRARLRLAEIALDEKQPEECLKWCRTLLLDKSQVDPAKVFRLMGRAYEQTGDHVRAAKFFRGELAGD